MIALYRLLTLLGGPLIDLLLFWRVRAGKEAPLRISERKGLTGAIRPEGALVWVHAASIGEALSGLPLMRKMHDLRPDLNFLITTGTVSSANILARQLPAYVMHQFAPFDRARWVRRFLAHWRPDMAIWIESEVWPNMILETAARGVPMALVNGRMSARSYRRWRLWKTGIKYLLNKFDVVLARDAQSLELIRNLGASAAICVGDLKQAADPLGVDEAELARLQDAIGARPVWLAASTHAGEEVMVEKTHENLRLQFPGLLTILAPRHAERGLNIATGLSLNDRRVVRRSKGEPPSSGADFYLADTMGEMGLIYRLATIVFMGGSLVPHGGQNPLEPARLGCAILHGPYIDNFSTIYAELDTAGAARQIANVDMLVDAVAGLLRDRQAAASRGRAAKAYTLRGYDRVLEHIIAALEPLLPVKK
ncbi:MAG TPA: 3-deoxy-D-manno-octulosonic acid transferase [Alphaproteobacteria bacterium]|nr:3-deoxy-D-manno-octulosonic acid transferase [Alphaproteobacteria bacterium]